MIEHEPKPESDLEFRSELSTRAHHGARRDRHGRGSAREIVRLRRHFDQAARGNWASCWRAVAAFAVGGIVALERQGSDAAKLLLGQARKISVLR